MSSLAGRVAIVTGAGRGIGRAVAIRLAMLGAKVVVCDVGAALDGTGTDAGPAREVVLEIEASGGTATARPIDVGDFGAAEAIVEETVTAFGRLDIVVNVAGIIRDRMLFNMTESEWDDVVRVHLKGTFNMSRHAAAYWKRLQREDGAFRLINFTSRAGLHGAPTQPNYVAAKMGIVGLTYSCANALTRFGVTTNAISPTADTRMMDSIPIDRRRSTGAPEQIAPAVGWLAGPESGWCNGQILAVKANTITLYTAPKPTVRITSSGGWDEQTLGGAAEKAFRQRAQTQVSWPFVDGDVTEYSF